MRLFPGLGTLILLIWTLLLNLYHAGVFPPPKITLTEEARGLWLDHSSAGINHLVLQGSDFARGKKAGELTASLLRQEEDALNDQLKGWIPSELLRQGLILGAIVWFQGIDRFLDSSAIQEMYGVSLSAPKKYDYIADGFTRQVAYHGLHEVGQLMVDQGFEDMGCTVVAEPYRNGFILGRNFDFEGGRIFDREKIVKWVFPEDGLAYVSVIWAGMVGAVTGVNEKGVYASLNAAGSDDFRRLGTPTTLVLKRVLQQAETSEQAVSIIQNATTFITDIFVVLDRHGHLYRVEKSPDKTAVIPLTGASASVITNHLLAPNFAKDKTNAFRKEELTTLAREARGQALVARLPSGNHEGTVQHVLKILRDKGVDQAGHVLNLGNRLAIDALIATHSVIYDPFDQILYVSQGPALVGPFLGYNLEKSFIAKSPIKERSLSEDTDLSPEDFDSIKQSNQTIAQAHQSIRKKHCQEGLAALQLITSRWREQSPYYYARGDAQSCLGHPAEARLDWQKALDKTPTYARFTRDLQKKLNP